MAKAVAVNSFLLLIASASIGAYVLDFFRGPSAKAGSVQYVIRRDICLVVHSGPGSYSPEQRNAGGARKASWPPWRVRRFFTIIVSECPT
jgi:hypothetical protein